MLELHVDDPPRRATLRCAAVLFDMDGTLVDSRACVERTWRAWCARHGLDAEALLRNSHGRRNHETVRIAAPHLDPAPEIAALVAAEEACRDGIVAVRGAASLLAALPPWRWAVVTSAWRRLAELRLRLAGLPTPQILVTADEVRRGKPDPEGYLRAAELLGVRPESCVVVEDAPAGTGAARAAGMRVVGITTTFERKRLDCDWCVPDLTAISAASPTCT